jgi:Asx homology domain
MMPNDNNISREENNSPKIKPGFLMYDQDWQHGIRGFQEDVQEGRYSPVWLSQAMEASKIRGEGGFDDYKESQYEEYWGQKQLVPLTMVAGLNSSLKIEALLQANVLRIGDVFVIRSKHNHGNNVWEKEATVS